MNCGDWVDSCSAIVEHYDGRMQLVRWMQVTPVSAPRAEAIAEASHS
jgi:hypothetical protein